MRFLITLQRSTGYILPINYSYPLSSAIYRILAKGDADYAAFLHAKGYGKGFKLFTFSQLKVPFKIEGDRLRLAGDLVSFQAAFHLPEAMENFVKGLFQSEKIDIADQKSKVSFSIQSIESLVNPLQLNKENEIVNIILRPISPIVAGLHNEKGNYNFLTPDDNRFTESLIFNWRNKIATCYDEQVATSALLMMEVIRQRTPFKSRLIAIKSDTPQETKVKGWMNYGIKVTGEKRFVELLLNAGAGLYNAQGMGCVEVV